MDDILVWGKDQTEHDQRLHAVMKRLRNAGLTLNEAKCTFSVDRVTYLGFIVTADGVFPDQEKVQAILNLKQPQNVSDLRRLLGMVNQLGKFIPNLSEKTEPLRSLLSKKNQWTWGQPQEQAFHDVKQSISSATSLALYDPSRDTVVSADASSFGLGAVIQQRQEDDTWHPIAYASRSLSDAEKRYAQVEKEALASTWACERFHVYLMGKHFTLETDHKPLVPLLGSKSVDELPARVQRFKLRLMRYSYDVVHVPGKELITADTLSRAPLSVSPTPEEVELEQDVKAYVESVTSSFPATEKRLEEIRLKQSEDEVCLQIIKYCQEGWPDRPYIKGAVLSFYPVSGELTVMDGLLMKGTRIVIPTSMRLEILDKIHEGHQGITKCRRRAQESVWWPGLSKQLETLVQNCNVCAKERVVRHEPNITTEFPKRPWQIVGTDLFQLKKSHYLVVVDYFSRYVELAKLTDLSSEAIINHLKSIFARHGVPERVRSDNGPQYSAHEFADFAEQYNFQHVTSSPLYPQGNAEVERAVQTVKALLKKAKDPYLALLAYRATPLQNGFSPAELLMGRRVRTNLPQHPNRLTPKWPDFENLAQMESAFRKKQADNADKRHGARVLPELCEGDKVWMRDKNLPATITGKADTPRSYVAETDDGTLFRRNRRSLSKLSPSTEVNVPMELPFYNASDKDMYSEMDVNSFPIHVGSEREHDQRELSSDVRVDKQIHSPRAQKDYVTRSGRMSKPRVRLDL